MSKNTLNIASHCMSSAAPTKCFHDFTKMHFIRAFLFLMRLAALFWLYVKHFFCITSVDHSTLFATSHYLHEICAGVCVQEFGKKKIVMTTGGKK